MRRIFKDMDYNELLDKYQEMTNENNYLKEEIYAKGCPNKRTEKYGYSPSCLNEWRHGLCNKPIGTCTNCANKSYSIIDEKVIEEHLRGKLVAGIYPMCIDEGCHFLAIGFDGDEWQKDISTLRGMCSEFDIPIAVERSRSGNGGHVWYL
jgi:hypothetical protein